MHDSGIERTLILPEVDPLLGPQAYFVALHDSLKAMYDDLAKRMNELLVFQEWGEMGHAQITSDQNDYDLGDGVVHLLSSDASRAITGFAAPPVGRMAILLNTGTQDITLPHQNAGSLAANRLITSTGGTLTLAANNSLAIWYSLDDFRWRNLTL